MDAPPLETQSLTCMPCQLVGKTQAAPVVVYRTAVPLPSQASQEVPLDVCSPDIA